MTREHGTADLTSFKVRIYVKPTEGLLTGMTSRLIMIANVIQSIREEIEAMTSGHFVPYHILSVLVSIIAAIFF